MVQRCEVCRGKSETAAAARAEWGCDRPTAHVQMEIPCPRCAGEGGEECKRCEGTGRENIHRCPRRLLTPEAVEAIRVHRGWPKTMIFAGGMYEQPAQYIAAMRILDSAMGKLDGIEFDGK